MPLALKTHEELVKKHFMRLNIELNIKMVVGYGYMTREES
jgi:hypothetical protein